MPLVAGLGLGGGGLWGLDALGLRLAPGGVACPSNPYLGDAVIAAAIVGTYFLDSLPQCRVALGRLDAMRGQRLGNDKGDGIDQPIFLC